MCSLTHPVAGGVSVVVICVMSSLVSRSARGSEHNERLYALKAAGTGFGLCHLFLSVVCTLSKFCAGYEGNELSHSCSD